VQIDTQTETGARNESRLAGVISHSDANYSEMKAYLESFLTQLGLDFAFEESKDEAFIPGRAVIVKINNKSYGVMGEVHPGVLSNFGIDYPVTMFEMGVEELV
jgi:phenylalanyl-tRNA synthetase beta chain